MIIGIQIPDHLSWILVKDNTLKCFEVVFLKKQKSVEIISKWSENKISVLLIKMMSFIITIIIYHNI